MGALEDDLDWNLRVSRKIDDADAIIDPIWNRAIDAVAVARIQFPQPNYVGLKVAEEAGEVIKAAVHYAEGRDTWEHVEKEVVQMIAMGLRLLVEGDERNGIIPPHKLPTR